MLVIDASLAVESSLDRAGEQISDSLDRNGELVAPPFLWSLVPAALHELAFRCEISAF